MAAGSGRRKVGDPLANMVREVIAMRDFDSMMQIGTVREWERVAVAEATERALNSVRTAWLRTLERWSSEWYARFMHRKPRARDFDQISYINAEIRRLRRALGVKPTPEQVREQTRDRTAAWRKRQRTVRAPEKPA